MFEIIDLAQIWRKLRDFVSSPAPEMIAPTYPLHIVLTETEFRALVAGKVVFVTASSSQEIAIILADIGFHRMLAAIDDADGDSKLSRG